MGFFLLEYCIIVAVECKWLHMDRERGEGVGGGEGESMRDLGKRRRHGLGGWKDRFKLVSLFEIINILLIVV